MPTKKKILIVDDGRAIRHWTQTIFANDYITDQAEDGEEALAKLPAFKPDLILLDVEMPKLNGLETCKKIRQDPNFRFIKIIFVSGNISIADRMAGYEAGGDDYVTKPYDEGELFAKVKTLLRLKNEEELNHLKSNFLSLISHETRTPINGILGCAELLNNSAEDNNRQLTEGILQASKQLHRLIENVLLICKLKSTPIVEQKKKKKQVGMIIQDQLKEMEHTIIHKNLSIAMSGNIFASVEACPTLLDKGFCCVLENAVKFSTPNGQIKIDISERDDLCIVQVTDQGPGIDPEEFDYIFDEFAISDVTHHHNGLGVSLSIAKQIFEGHGGEIKAKNDRKQGAIFTITLPAANKCASAAA